MSNSVSPANIQVEASPQLHPIPEGLNPGFKARKKLYTPTGERNRRKGPEPSANQVSSNSASRVGSSKAPFIFGNFARMLFRGGKSRRRLSRRRKQQTKRRR